jgi:hypothetical protein
MCGKGNSDVHSVVTFISMVIFIATIITCSCRYKDHYQLKRNPEWFAIERIVPWK